MVVTNLNASGAGSLRDALALTVPRIIVFKPTLTGVINFSPIQLRAPANNNFTILGQTSIGGITLTGGNFANYGGDDGGLPLSNFIIRHLRIRRTDGGDTFAFNPAANFILDHCEGSGSSDEVFDFDLSHDFTLQWSAYLNGNNTVDQGKGMLIGYAPTQNVTIHHNFSAHFDGRNGAQMHWLGALAFRSSTGAASIAQGAVVSGATSGAFGTLSETAPSHAATGAWTLTNVSGINWIDGEAIRIGGVQVAVVNGTTTWAPSPLGAALDIRNNVIYPNSVNATNLWRTDDPAAVGVRANFVGNYSKSGPSKPASPTLMGGYPNNRYVSGNVYAGGADGQASSVGTEYSFPNPVTTTSAAVAYQSVLDLGGAWPPDAMLIRTRNEVRDGRGSLNKWNDPLNTNTTGPATVMCYDGTTFTSYSTVDSNNDGFPDAWAAAHGNPSPAAISPSGYAWIEVYANEVAAAIAAGQTSVLEQKAALLAANQSILVGTVPSTFFDPVPGDNLNYGAHAVYDEIRRELRFIGKPADSVLAVGQKHYTCTSYSLRNGFVLDPFTLAAGLLTDQPGHGYSNNAMDPDTGDHYFKSYSSDAIYKWTAATSTWSQLPSLGGNALGGIAWCIVGGVGRLVAVDNLNFKYFNGSTWTALNGNNPGVMQDPANDYHRVVQYNDTTKVLLQGGGNGGNRLFRWDFSAASPSLVTAASPSFPIGAGSPSQGPLCSVPDDSLILAHQKNSSNWAMYDIARDVWTALTQSSGAGATPQLGPPNLTFGGDARTVCAPIRLPGRSKITAWLHTNDTQGYRLELWLYKAPDTTFVTNFPTAENPISPTIWTLGGNDYRYGNNPLSAVGRCTASVQSGTSANPNHVATRYDDNIACIKPSYMAFPPNQYAKGTVYKAAGYSGNGGSHEIELLLHFNMANGSATGYEILWGIQGYIAIVRWNGDVYNANYTPLYDPGAGSAPVPQDGDTLEARIVNNVITVYRNGVLMAGVTATNSTYPTGQPGLGFWPVDGATPGSLGWKTFEAGRL